MSVYVDPATNRRYHASNRKADSLTCGNSSVFMFQTGALWQIQAWSGSGWVAITGNARITNFGSHQEAERYARSFGFAVTDRIVDQGGAR